MPIDLNLRIPSQLQTVNRVELVADNKREVAEAYAPTLEHLVSAAGITLTADQTKDLQQSFLERGVLHIPVGGANMSATVSVEANSLNYTSKVGRQTRPA